MPFKGLMFVIGFATMIQSAFAANGGVRYNLPQFGLYMDGYGQVLERAPDGNDEMWWRPVTDLISEWKSQYLVREPKEEETDEMQSTWRAKNFVAIDARFSQLKESHEIKSIEDFIAFLAKEYMSYGLDVSKWKGCVDRLNKLAKDKWMLGIFGGKTTVTTYRKKAENTYRDGLAYVEKEMRVLIMPLHKIHQQEFLKWKAQNPDEFVRLKKLDNDLITNVVLQKKIDAATEEARLAKEQAAAAEAAAWAAEQAARDAEDAANRARWRRW